jgi:glycosyltransferase involved in cell wall biosynthesis
MTKILAVFGNVALFGQERSNIHVFHTLKENGANVLLLVNDRGFHWHLKPEVDSHNLPYKEIRFPWNFKKTKNIHKLWLYLNDTVLYNIQFYKEYRKFQPDYIHIANDFFFTTLTPILFFIRCPIVYRLGDKPVRRYFYEKWFWKNVITKITTQFVCISNFIADELKKVRPSLKNFTIIYNIPTPRIVNDSENLPLANPDCFTVLYVGQIIEGKGVHLLYNAALKLIGQNQKFRFIFAGPLFQSHFYNTISKTHDYKTNKQNLIFTDKVQNILHLYKIADVLVVPSLVPEALSNVVGEAKSVGCPAIVFPSGGLSELIENNYNGFICNVKTEQSIIDHIQIYFDNPTLLKEHSKNALSSIKSLGLTQELFIKKWLKIYDIA